MDECDQCGGWGYWAEKPTFTLCPECYGTGYPPGKGPGMNFNEYQKLAARTECPKDTAKALFDGKPGCDHHWMQVILSGARLRAERSDLVAKLNHGIIGLGGEVGELCTLWQKILYYGRPMTNDIAAGILEECGDVLWYVALICNALGINMEALATGNIKKLEVRYPGLFRDVLDRDKQEELKGIMEQP